MIVCWFYTKNIIFEHMIDRIFLVTSPLFGDPRFPLPSKMDEVLEPALPPSPLASMSFDLPTIITD